MAQITEARLVGDWRRIVGDVVVSHENAELSDDVGVTGTVTLTPNFGKGPQGVLADDASLYTAHEIKCRVMWGRLHDNDLNNPWQDLIVAVDGKPIVWTAAFSLTYKWRSDVQAQKIALPQVTFDMDAITAGEISLTSLIPSAQIPSNYEPYLVSAQASAQVASDAKTVAELSAQAADQAKADATLAKTAAETAKTAAETAKTDAETAATLATTEADRAVGLATAQDQAVADTVLAGGPTTTALNNTYAQFGSASRPSARAVVIGCSIENLHSFRSTEATSTSEQFGGGDWPTWAMLLSSGRFHLVRNMGVGGETTAQYLARFDTDVAPSVGRGTLGQANVVVIGGLENDIQQSTYSLEASRANIVEMVNRTRSLGAVPILRTTMPHHLSAEVRTKIGAANQWIRNYGVEQGIIVLDFWRLVVDPATGQFRSNMSADGVHPNELAARAMGQHTADVLAAAGPPVASSALAFDPTDTGLLAPNPLFLTDTEGTPTTWNALGGTPTGVTRSMVTDPQVPGRMARIAHVGSTTDNVGIANNSSIINTTKASPGEIVEVLGVVTSDGGVRADVNVTVNYNDGTAKNIGRVVYFAAAVTRGEYRFRLPPLPDGFTNIIVTCLTRKGTGVVDFSYPTVRNLTREGAI